LAAGLCPDPLGKLKRSPRPIATIRDYFSGDGGDGMEEKGRKGRGKGREGENSPWPAHFSEASAAYDLSSDVCRDHINYPISRLSLYQIFYSYSIQHRIVDQMHYSYLAE